MFHPNTQHLIDYWTARARNGEAPSRASVHPGDLRQLVSQVFILGRTMDGRFPVRLAGGLVAELHRRDLRGVDALSLWADRDRRRLASALDEIRRRPRPLVIGADGLTGEGASLPLEVLLAPLTAHDGGPDRVLGLYQPLGMVSRLKGGAVQALSIRAMGGAEAANEEPARPVRLAAVDGLRIA